MALRQCVKQLRSTDGVLDVFLFGSTARGDTAPRDVDLLILFEKRIDENVVHAFKTGLADAGFDVDVRGRTWSGLFESIFLARESILSDAYSLFHHEFLSELFGYRSFILFRYSLFGKSATTRVLFHYALNGRKSANTKKMGMIENLNAVKLSNSTILVPSWNSEHFSKFLNDNAVSFKKFPVLVPLKVVTQK